METLPLSICPSRWSSTLRLQWIRVCYARCATVSAWLALSFASRYAESWADVFVRGLVGGVDLPLSCDRDAHVDPTPDEEKKINETHDIKNLVLRLG